MKLSMKALACSHHNGEALVSINVSHGIPLVSQDPYGWFQSRSAPVADLLDDHRPVAKHLSQNFLKFMQ